MGKVILDAATCAQLNGLGELVELQNQAGELIGYALPPRVYNALMTVSVYGPFTEEELNAPIDLNDPGRPLEDILADLRKL
jgi:hypothetical protein